MKKTAYSLIFALLLCLLLPLSTSIITAVADGGDGRIRLVDDAELLDESQITGLLAKLDEISLRQRCDVVIVSVNALDGKTGTEYADDYFDYNGYGIGAGGDGILLLICMDERVIVMSTKGFGIKAFTDAGQGYMWDEFLHYISDGNYFVGFNRFAVLCDEFLEQARNGKPYDTGNMPNDPGFLKTFVNTLPISLVIGVIIAFVVTGIMKSKLKSVRMQAAAANYVKEGSVNITSSSDNFLYKTVKKTERETSSSSGGGSSTHSSSSGSTHGGSSRNF